MIYTVLYNRALPYIFDHSNNMSEDQALKELYEYSQYSEFILATGLYETMNIKEPYNINVDEKQERRYNSNVYTVFVRAL